MGKIRIERYPVQSFNLGVLGFDHLQLVFEPNDRAGELQDNWYLIEGLREPMAHGIRLSVEGWEGRTTLAQANGGVFGEELEAKIATPSSRGSRVLAVGIDAHEAWATMASFAGDIEAQGFPYIAISLPGSPLPTINSSSLAGTLLYRIGLDISASMPGGARLSPGTATLIGSSDDDTLSVVNGFTTLIGGEGNDTLAGSNGVHAIDKLYGGKDDDHITWSRGFNIVHGGLTELPYEKDGVDTLSYAGAGTVRIDANPHPVPHMRPDFIATFEGGLDHLFSIEEIAWSRASDRIILGKGVGLIERPITFRLGAEEGSGKGDEIEFAEGEGGLLIISQDRELMFIQAEDRTETSAGLWVEGAEWLVGSPGPDRIYTGPALRGVDGGDGDDLIDATSAEASSGRSPRGYDLEIDGGSGDDTIVAGVARIAATGGPGADRFVVPGRGPGGEAGELVIEDASVEDRLVSDLLGPVRIRRDGDDVLIELSPTAAEETTGDGQGARPFVHRVRVRNFEDGDLGLDLRDGTAMLVASADPGRFILPDEGRQPRPAARFHESSDQGPGDDGNLITGTADDDVMVLGGSADATIEAGAGDDTIIAGSGDDILDGGAGRDLMIGGAGNDIYFVSTSGDSVIEGAESGIDLARSRVDYALPDFVEHLELAPAHGAAAAATVGIGNGVANRIIGNDGPNALFGLDGDDTLFGGRGSDLLVGGAGADGYVYMAGDGADIIQDFGPSDERDVLILGGLRPEEVTFHDHSSRADDLVLELAHGGQIQVTGFWRGAGIDAISFDDGTVWERDDLEALAENALAEGRVRDGLGVSFVAALSSHEVPQARALQRYMELLDRASSHDYASLGMTDLAAGMATCDGGPVDADACGLFAP